MSSFFFLEGVCVCVCGSQLCGHHVNSHLLRYQQEHASADDPYSVIGHMDNLAGEPECVQ